MDPVFDRANSSSFHRIISQTGQRLTASSTSASGSDKRNDGPPSRALTAALAILPNALCVTLLSGHLRVPGAPTCAFRENTFCVKKGSNGSTSTPCRIRNGRYLIHREARTIVNNIVFRAWSLVNKKGIGQKSGGLGMAGEIHWVLITVTGS